MSYEEEETKQPEWKVFVSRIPAKWTKELMLEHFKSMEFGEVLDVEIFTGARERPKATMRGAGNLCFAFKNNGFCPKGDECLFSHQMEEFVEETDDSNKQHLGSGCVYFATEEGMKNALDQSTLHLSRRLVKISPFQSADEGRDCVTCYAWQRFNCTHGDECKFSHDGPGACEKVGVKYQGRKFQCLSFKKTGKCSKGDYCTFIHSFSGKKNKANSEAGEDEKQEQPGEKRKLDEASDGASKKKGICDSFKKKGKCRKGDRCPYSHDIQSSGSGSGDSSAVVVAKSDEEAKKAKRRKIDGSILVQKRAENNKIKFDA